MYHFCAQTGVFDCVFGIFSASGGRREHSPFKVCPSYCVLWTVQPYLIEEIWAAWFRQQLREGRWFYLRVGPMT